MQLTRYSFIFLLSLAAFFHGRRWQKEEEKEEELGCCWRRESKGQYGKGYSTHQKRARGGLSEKLDFFKCFLAPGPIVRFPSSSRHRKVPNSKARLILNFEIGIHSRISNACLVYYTSFVFYQWPKLCSLTFLASEILNRLSSFERHCFFRKLHISQTERRPFFSSPSRLFEEEEEKKGGSLFMNKAADEERKRAFLLERAFGSPSPGRGPLMASSRPGRPE